MFAEFVRTGVLLRTTMTIRTVALRTLSSQKNLFSKCIMHNNNLTLKLEVVEVYWKSDNHHSDTAGRL